MLETIQRVKRQVGQTKRGSQAYCRQFGITLPSRKVNSTSEAPIVKKLLMNTEAWALVLIGVVFSGVGPIAVAATVRGLYPSDEFAWNDLGFFLTTVLGGWVLACGLIVIWGLYRLFRQI